MQNKEHGKKGILKTLKKKLARKSSYSDFLEKFAYLELTNPKISWSKQEGGHNRDDEWEVGFWRLILQEN